MVLTAAQTAAFFTAQVQMGIPAAAYAQMQVEGIETVDDLVDFDKETLDQMASNLRRPAGRVPNPDAGAAGTIPTPGFVFGARSMKRLLVACDIVRYYTATGRPFTAGNLQWTPVVKNFEIQWKALKQKKEAGGFETPKITKALPIMKWAEAFPDFLNQVVGARNVPLSYVIREQVDVPVNVPALENNQPHSAEHGSVEAELIARVSHDHALYRDDNAKVYHYLSEATISTAYAASIKPYQRTKDGRGAWMALINQYAGVDEWEAEIKRQEQLLHTRKWKGQSNFSLEAFISQHHNAFVSMQACAEHVQYQLPNEHSRVGFVLEGIESTDAGLQAAMASVRTDNGPTGKRNDFEAAVAHIIPYDPVAKRRSEGKKQRTIAVVDVNNDADISATTAKKPSIGKTGVHFRYYSQKEYQKLNQEQRAELREWRASRKRSGGNNDANKQSKKGKKPPSSGNISATALNDLLDERIKLMVSDATAEEPTRGNTADVPAMTPATPAAANISKITLKSILKNLKN